MGTLCLFFSVFGEFQAPPNDQECELQCFQSFSVDPYGHKYSWNDAEEDGGKKDCFGTCGQGLEFMEEGCLMGELG